MMPSHRRTPPVRPSLAVAAIVGSTLLVAAIPRPAPPEAAAAIEATEATDAPGPNPDAVLRGRALVLEHACGGCHGGGSDPAAENWLIGMTSPEEEFRIGPCGDTPETADCFRTRPRNLTPHNTTGLGRFTERQIFNALRYGLRPGETADVEITSATPGEGNFPEHPKYLAPPMPWPAWRHIPDEDLWAIAAYLKHGLQPVENRVPDSEGPPDFWASGYTEERMGAFPAPPFPTAREKEPGPGVDRSKVLRGRQVAIQHDCGGCHGGGPDAASESWLMGITSPDQDFLLGDCDDPDSDACFRVRPRNLTPHPTAGVGRYSERQIFNALRHGLRPGGTPDVEITGDEPGVGGFPEHPDYLAPGMPWSSWRHMSDEDLWALAAYLKHGVRPVDNEVPDSESPPDAWASEYTPEKIGTYPAAPFPTAREVDPRDG